MREENACAAANDSLLQTERTPREAKTWAEVIPVGLVRLRRPAILSGEFNDARRPRNGVNRCRIEAVHAVVAVGDRSVSLPSQAEIKGQRLTDRPVVLEKSRQIPAVAIQCFRLAECHTVRVTKQQAGKADAGPRVARLSGQQGGEAELSRDRRAVGFEIE